MLNKVQLIGNLGRDAEIRTFQNGGKVAQLRVATAEYWKDRQTGERREKTEWHTVVVHVEPLMAAIERHYRKGATIYVEGQLQTRKWQDNNGVERYSTEVVVSSFGGAVKLVSKPVADGGAAPPADEAGRSSDPPKDDLDDDVPF